MLTLADRFLASIALLRVFFSMKLTHMTKDVDLEKYHCFYTLPLMIMTLALRTA